VEKEEELFVVILSVGGFPARRSKIAVGCGWKKVIMPLLNVV
jgi:hypothetical protein